jgi:magnesium transporter
VHGPVVATPLMDTEDVARLIAKYDLLAVPVVDNAAASWVSSPLTTLSM